MSSKFGEPSGSAAFDEPTSDHSACDAVYSALSDHQLRQGEWDHQPIIAELHRFRQIFDSEFKLELSPTVFRIGGARSSCYGHFRPGHNQFGLTREIAFTECHLRARLAAGDVYQILGTELHELLHAWQFDHGKPSPWGHHNREFRDKAKSLGLVVNSRGVTEYSPNSPFFQVIVKYGVHVPRAAKLHSIVAADALGNGSKLKKWSCRCKPPVNARVAVSNFRALCLVCNRPFRKCE